MSGSAPQYSIIIPAYNEEAALPATLEALHRCMQGLPWQGELIVVDNNSSDRTAAIAEAGGARVVFEPVNQIARARNTGGRIARGRWLIFVDADTTLQPWLLHDALSLLEQGQVCGGGAQLAFSADVAEGAAAINRLWNQVSRRMRYAAGCFVFCTREGFQGTGGFPESVYASEEIWFSRALARWGKRQGQRMHIFRQGGLHTSPRKLRWHSPWRVAGMLLLFTVFPAAVRSRRLCWFWYQRPATDDTALGSIG